MWSGKGHVMGQDRRELWSPSPPSKGHAGQITTSGQRGCLDGELSDRTAVARLQDQAQQTLKEYLARQGAGLGAGLGMGLGAENAEDLTSSAPAAFKSYRLG